MKRINTTALYIEHQKEDFFMGHIERHKEAHRLKKFRERYATKSEPFKKRK